MLRRDVLPVLKQKGVKLLAIGIGSAESAASFADKLDFPADMLLADESEESTCSAHRTRDLRIAPSLVTFVAPRCLC